MPNLYKNKVVKSTGETLIDLTSDTVTAGTLLKDVTAHDRSGAPIVGEAVIPTVNDGTLTIQQNGTTKATFTANQSSNVTANIIVPTTPADIGAAPLTSSSTIDFVGEGISLKKPGETNASFTVRTQTVSGVRENWLTVDAPNSSGARGVFIHAGNTATTIGVACQNAETLEDYGVHFEFDSDIFYGGVLKSSPLTHDDNHFKFNLDCAGDSIGRAANSGAALSGSTLDLWYESAKLNGKKILTDDDINGWRDLQMKVRKNDMADIDTSDQYVCSKGSGTITWDVIGKNIDTPADPNRTNALTLRVDECLPDNLQFDAPEALYACSEVMPAGTYHYTAGGTSYQFTTTRAYPIGGQFVCTDDATLYTYTSASSTSAQETLTVTQGNGGTDLGTLSNNVVSGNLNTVYRRKYGSNDWKESAIRQWLNSNKPAGQWWEPQNPWDRPPAYAKTANGFLYDLDPEFLAVIGKTQVTTNYFDTSTGTLNGTYTTEDYFFLMSQSQVSSDYSGEGTKYTPYSDDASRIMYKNGSPFYYWLRSPYSSASSHVYLVGADGSMYNYYGAYGSGGVAAACNII